MPIAAPFIVPPNIVAELTVKVVPTIFSPTFKLPTIPAPPATFNAPVVVDVETVLPKILTFDPAVICLEIPAPPCTNKPPVCVVVLSPVPLILIKVPT